MKTAESTTDLSDYLGKKILKKIKADELYTHSPESRLKVISGYLKKIIEKEKIIISDKEIFRLAREIHEDSFGFGPISLLINDDRITEIMINNFDQVYIEKDAVIKKTDIIFRDNDHIRNLIDKTLSPLGLRIDESSPMVDARLKNGSRINVVLNPAASNDIVVTIRKFKRNMMDVGSLIKEGTLNKAVADFIKTCVRSRLNIIISGGTSTGKTTFLNVLSNFIRQYERIVTIEETLELNLNLPHVVKLEGRPPNLEGKGGITIRDLVRNSLRMRPDRIVVGEIRGAEAVDVLQAMNTGHSGSMTTVHANSPKDMISRLETMILMSGLNLNSSAARRMIASSVDIIIHLDKLKNGKRVLVRISELKNKSGPIGRNTVLEVKDIFGYTAGEKIAKGTGFYAGKLVHTGYIPDFIEKIKNKGFDFNFKNEKLE